MARNHYYCSLKSKFAKVQYYVCSLEKPRPNTVLIGCPLLAEAIYCEEASREGGFHQGTCRFIFRNISSDKTLTICLPALAVYCEAQPNNFHQEDPASWPKFANEHRTFTLPPDGEQVFEEPYGYFGSSVPPGWCFVFGPGDGIHQPPGEVYVGCTVAAGKMETEPEREAGKTLPNAEEPLR